MEPLTVIMSDEKKKKKQEQQRAKAPPPGASRILTRATKEQNKKNNQVKQPSSAMPIPPPQAQVQKSQTIKPSVTPQPPSPPQQQQTVTVNETKVTTQKQAQIESPRSNTTTTNENLDEWTNFAEDLNPEVNFELCEKMIKEENFLQRLKKKLQVAKNLMLEGKIEGASIFRELCKILCNLLSIEFNEYVTDDEDDDDNNALNKNELKKSIFLKQMLAFENFCNFLDIPQFFSDLLKQFLNEKSNLKVLKEVIFCSMLLRFLIQCVET